MIRDLASGDVLSAPTIVFERGEGAEVVSQLPDDSLVRFEVNVAESGTRATYRAERVIDGTVVSAQSATVEF